MARTLRYALDLGTNSLGWAVLTDGEVLAAGVRIFPDGRNPKDKQSLAVMRRGPRAARRRRDRFLQRQRALRHVLAGAGIELPQLPKHHKGADPMDPLTLRVAALDRALAPQELARVLWHLNQRRGFQSNRKTDGKDKDSGVVKAATANLSQALRDTGARTLGEFLHRRRKISARFRTHPDPKVRFEYYPARDMVKAEFDAIWAAQAPHHPGLLTDQLREAVAAKIFHQRPLKKPAVGKCTFNPEEPRAPKALPSVEAREIYERLNALKYGTGLSLATPLSRTERDALASTLLTGRKLGWDGVRKALKLSGDTQFNLDVILKELPSARTAAQLGRPDAFGKAWHAKPLDEKDAIVTRFLEAEDEGELAAWLVAEHGFSADAADRLAGLTPGGEGYGRLGLTANAQILEQLRADHLAVYSVACERAGYHHSDFRTGEVKERLPYYGVVLERHIIDSDPNLREAVAGFRAQQRASSGLDHGKPHARKFAGAGLAEAQTGRVPNPTVHIGLNQLRLVINALIQRFGKPDQIVLEIARELKMPEEVKKRLDQENRRNREKNDERRAWLASQGIEPNGETMARLRLWDEQMRGGVVLCPYTLRTIRREEVIGGSVDVDHIIPFSVSLDDSTANKVLCDRAANRQKRNRLPWEAFGNDPLWPQILANAQSLGRSRAWRFAPDALEEFEKEGRGFLDRQLNETKHLARLARTYLEVLAPDNVWVVTGKLTAMLRGKWGLNDILGDHNRKNRNDHRHHAVDAIVIGYTTRSILQKVSTAAGRAEGQLLDRLFDGLDPPFPGFRDQVRTVVNAITVSHKPEHGKGGALHEDTAYGLKVQPHELALGNVVYRKPLDGLTLKDVDRVRDPDLRADLQQLRMEVGSDEKAFRQAVTGWAAGRAAAWRAANPDSPNHRNPIRRVRVLKPEAALVPVHNRQTGEAYKGLVPAENWCVDIVKMRDGSWKGFGATIFEVNTKGWRPVWEREKLGGLLVMRLHKGDLVELEDPDGVRRVKRVVQLEPSANRMRLAPTHEGGRLQERNDLSMDEDSFRWDLAAFSKLAQRGARKVKVEVDGSLIKLAQ